MRCNEYIVRPDQGVVIGIMHRNNLKGILKEIGDSKKNKLLPFLTYWLYVAGYIKDIHSGEGPIKGVAKCQEPDEFSEKTGKQIADIKATYKYHIAMARKYRQLIRILRKMLGEVEEYELKHYNAANKLDEKLKTFM